jgi:two-component system KDP operon response regulator KdpE
MSDLDSLPDGSSPAGVKPLVVVVEDEASMRKFVRASLVGHGYRVVEAEDAREGIAQTKAHNPDIVLLDLGLPDRDGLEVTKDIRSWSAVPIVVISARGQESDKVNALDAGADDYLTKPFGVAELMARMRVTLRHRARADFATTLRQTVEVRGLKVDLERRQVLRSGVEVHFTPIEYKLFLELLKNLGKVVTHRQLLLGVWGPGHTNDARYLRVHMAQLRRKLEPEPRGRQFIVTETGVGYRFKDE